MKTVLPSSSKEHETIIHEIKDIILKSYKEKISHIILFGSFARGNWVYDYYKEDGHDLEYASDYDFLIITKKAKAGSGYQATSFKNKIGKKLKEFKRPYKSHTPTIIIESIDRVNKELEKGRYFFSDIKKEGICLYDSGEFELKEPRELSNQEIKEIAEDDFKQWFESADEFLDGVIFYMQKNMLNKAAFHLHQTTEGLLNCTLLVLTGYKPKSHDLEELLGLCSSQTNKFLNIFPTGNKEQEDCFELLNKAYVDARYSKDYTITKEQLEYLISKVEKLKEITKQVCLDKINSFK